MRGIAIALCLLLAACTPKVITACPPVPFWSEAASLELADEIDSLGSVAEAARDMRALAASLEGTPQGDAAASLAARLEAIQDPDQIERVLVEAYTMRNQARACR